MSATLDVDVIKDWFNAPHFHAPGNVHDNEITYAPKPVPLRGVVSEVSRQVITFTQDPNAQNILVFLPGVREIEDVHTELMKQTNVRISKLHGQVPLAEQSRILGMPHQQIVLATNIAETSLTIPHVNRVVDAGWRREARYVESWTSQALFTSRITLFSAQQRAGRANRTTAGKVYRLWTKYEQVQFAEQDQPEIQTSNLDRLYLECLAWGCAPNALSWLTSPPENRLQDSKHRLMSLGALKTSGLTDTAKDWHLTALSPRGNAVLSDIACASEEDRASIAYLLPLLDGERAPNRHLTNVQARLSSLPKRHSYTKTVELLSKKLRLPKDFSAPSPILSKAVLESILIGFPERLGRLRNSDSKLYLMSNGTGGRLHASIATERSEFVLALSVGGQKSAEMTIFDVLPVQRSWIPFAKRTDVFFSDDDQKVVCRKRQGFGALIVSEQPDRLPNDPDRIAACLADAALLSPQKAFKASDALAQLSLRVQYANQQNAAPPLAAPFNGLDMDHRWEELLEICAGQTSFADLQRVDLANHYLSRLSYAHRQQLDERAPTQLTLSNGQTQKVTYTKAHGPTLSTRFEWLFGVPSTPQINHQPVMLELLAPNMRPIQLTRDLESFWTKGYPDVKRTLRGRYPKHPWPDDPLTAPPGVGRRRKRS